MIRRPPRSTQSRSSAASDVYKRQVWGHEGSLVHVCVQPAYVLHHRLIRRANRFFCFSSTHAQDTVRNHNIVSVFGTVTVGYILKLAEPHICKVGPSGLCSLGETERNNARCVV
eukprot:TRINITY_DN22491_c0_g1_i1.p1 TRINITY_DN22491_c0_g1~~TRINITY_DN22491_c0_g1_i1.p1  ORF type:complete len:114 (+),score=31.76 TRINITY_DN22491_c0_g1_i1:153-494(+)